MFSNKKSNYSRYPLVLFVGILVGGISIFIGKQPSVPISEPIKLSIGIAKEPLAALAIVAAEKNFFEGQGLDITIKQYKGGKQALVEGLLAGQVELATSADVPIMFNCFQRTDFTILSTIGTSDNEPRIIARRDRNIGQPEDLAGKRVLTKKNSAVHFFLNVFLFHSNLSSSDITLTFSKDGSGMAKALVDGEIDAFSHREPFIGEAKELLGDNAIVFEKPGIYRKTFNLLALEKTVQGKAVAVEKVLQALVIAEKFIQENPTESLQIVAQFIGSSEENLNPIWQNNIIALSLDQTLLVTLEAQARWAIANHVVDSKETPNFLDFVSSEPLRKINPDAVGIY